MAGNLGKEDQIQKVKEVQKEQETEVEATDHPKSIPKVTSTSKKFFLFKFLNFYNIYIYIIYD